MNPCFIVFHNGSGVNPCVNVFHNGPGVNPCVIVFHNGPVVNTDVSVFHNGPGVNPDVLVCSQRERIHERCKAICPNKDGVEAVSSINQNNGIHHLILVAMAATLVQA